MPGSLPRASLVDDIGASLIGAVLLVGIGDSPAQEGAVVLVGIGSGQTCIDVGSKIGVN